MPSVGADGKSELTTADYVDVARRARASVSRGAYALSTHAEGLHAAACAARDAVDGRTRARVARDAEREAAAVYDQSSAMASTIMGMFLGRPCSAAAAAARAAAYAEVTAGVVPAIIAAARRTNAAKRLLNVALMWSYDQAFGESGGRADPYDPVGHVDRENRAFYSAGSGPVDVAMQRAAAAFAMLAAAYHVADGKDDAAAARRRSDDHALAARCACATDMVKVAKAAAGGADRAAADVCLDFVDAAHDRQNEAVEAAYELYGSHLFIAACRSVPRHIKAAVFEATRATAAAIDAGIEPPAAETEAVTVFRAAAQMCTGAMDAYALSVALDAAAAAGPGRRRSGPPPPRTV